MTEKFWMYLFFCSRHKTLCSETTGKIKQTNKLYFSVQSSSIPKEAHQSGTLSRLNWNLEVLVFEEPRRKLEYPEENLSEQGREPTTNSTHIWRQVRESKPGHIGWRPAGKCSTTTPSLLHRTFSFFFRFSLFFTISKFTNLNPRKLLSLKEM